MEEVLMFAKDWKKDLFTIPNVLSLFRLLLIPVYIILYLRAEKPEDYFLAAAILAVSCLTDLIDGKIARHFNMISNTGKILDPLADKATQFTLIICLMIRRRTPVLLFLAVLFVIKEAFQAIAGFLILRKGKILKGALIAGKISTTVLFISLIVLVLVPDISDLAVHIITGIDIAVLLFSFISYVRLYYTHSPMIQSIDENVE
jgi:cardiolipin synthase